LEDDDDDDDENDEATAAGDDDGDWKYDDSTFDGPGPSKSRRQTFDGPVLPLDADSTFALPGILNTHVSYGIFYHFVM